MSKQCFCLIVKSKTTVTRLMRHDKINKAASVPSEKRNRSVSASILVRVSRVDMEHGSYDTSILLKCTTNTLSKAYVIRLRVADMTLFWLCRFASQSC